MSLAIRWSGSFSSEDSNNFAALTVNNKKRMIADQHQRLELLRNLILCGAEHPIRIKEATTNYPFSSTMLSDGLRTQWEENELLVAIEDVS